jgi:hypothetical protein
MFKRCALREHQRAIKDRAFLFSFVSLSWFTAFVYAIVRRLRPAPVFKRFFCFKVCPSPLRPTAQYTHKYLVDVVLQLLRQVDDEYRNRHRSHSHKYPLVATIADMV